MSISMGAMLALMLTMEMDGIPRIIVSTILALLFGFGIVFIMEKHAEYEAEKWNNGICTKCGTEWHFQGASGRSSSKVYYYVCDNGHILETENLFQKE
jgi:hypothetical protein